MSRGPPRTPSAACWRHRAPTPPSRGHARWRGRPGPVTPTAQPGVSSPEKRAKTASTRGMELAATSGRCAAAGAADSRRSTVERKQSLKSPPGRRGAQIRGPPGHAGIRRRGAPARIAGERSSTLARPAPSDNRARRLEIRSSSRPGRHSTMNRCRPFSEAQARGTFRLADVGPCTGPECLDSRRIPKSRSRRCAGRSGFSKHSSSVPVADGELRWRQ